METFSHIEDEDDLEQYSIYLKNESNNNNTIIGKNAKVEFIFGNRKEVKFGKIIDLDENKIILELQKTKNTLYCDAKRVSFIYIFN